MSRDVQEEQVTSKTVQLEDSSKERSQRRARAENIYETPFGNWRRSSALLTLHGSCWPCQRSVIEYGNQAVYKADLDYLDFVAEAAVPLAKKGRRLSSMGLEEKALLIL